ncbi:allophanate hydrolase [Paenibacillus ihuae]|uniref:allophanate hydrolase n=1 Tax=Paenibacillus ihuae TaxID=1232431 RepID=UPI0006D59F22|nr:allophanate hydrolase [Paenibacillus ihuae]
MSMNLVPSQLTIRALHNGYRTGKFTAVEVISAIIERSKSDEDKAIWILPPSQERIQPYLERLQELNPKEFPLWGIPFAIKDNIEVANWPVTAACPDFGYESSRHAAVVERLIAAGAIPIGKTNMDQFATGLVGTRSPYGATHNALRPDLISGGSSSGSAVAVARGHAAFALGTDTAGSGRVPAALNGLIGYKPAVGAWPTAGIIPACRSLDCVTVFAHTIEDAEAVDRQVRGYLSSDPYSADRPLGRAATPDMFLIPSGPLEFFGPYAASYQEAWELAKKKLLLTNLKVQEADIGLLHEAAAQLYEGPWVAERWSDLETFIEKHPGSTLPVTESILRSGAKADFTAASLFRSQHRIAEIRSLVHEMLKGAVLVLPTAGGTWTREQVIADPVATNGKMGLYTNHCNLLDLSAVSIPAGEAEDRLPFGITLFALPEEEMNLRAAARLIISQSEDITIAVCGLHMRGMPLERQMLDFGAEFLEEAETAPLYELYMLPNVPSKPGLIRVPRNGASIELELWRMPAASFGQFVAQIPAPLGIGKIELTDGRLISGFLCEAYAIEKSLDITAHGGWRAALSSRESRR